MNKHTKIYSENPLEKEDIILSEIYLLSESERLTMNYIRMWFSKEKLVPKFKEQLVHKIVRDLNIKYGYFRGYKLTKSINEFCFFLFKCEQSTLSINIVNDEKISDDEFKIIKIIFPNFSSDEHILAIAQRMVSRSDAVKLLTLAKDINLSF